MGITSIVAGRDGQELDIELGLESVAPLVIYDHGRVEAGEIGALSPPEGECPDALVWSWDSCSRRTPHDLYLLGMWTWSLLPRRIRCVLPPSARGDQALRDLRRHVPWYLRRAGVSQSIEVLQRPRGWKSPSSRIFFRQILESALSAPRFPRRILRQSRRAGVGILAAFFACCLSMAPARAQEEGSSSPSIAVVEIEGLDHEEARVLRADGGAELYVGPWHFVRVQPGAGAWSSESDRLTLSSRRDELEVELDGSGLGWGSGEHGIAEQLVIHAPEYSLLVRGGSVDMRPDVILVDVRTRSPPFSGRTGLMVALVLAAVILLLMWRATSVQRRLDQPRPSMRRSRPSGRD